MESNINSNKADSRTENLKIKGIKLGVKHSFVIPESLFNYFKGYHLFISPRPVLLVAGEMSKWRPSISSDPLISTVNNAKPACVSIFLVVNFRL